MMKADYIRNTVLPYGHHCIDKSDVDAVVDVLHSDWITQGSKISEFEKRVAGYCNSRYAVVFSSGTAALHGAVNAANIRKGDEVVCTPMSFVASSNCVLYCDGVVRFADVKPGTFNIDPVEIRKNLSDKTRMIIPVDYAGQPCDLDEIRELAVDNGLVVVEDASHSLGALYKGKPVGGLMDMTVFSFHPVKSITCGEGGMVLTNNEDFYESLLMFRSHGVTRDKQKLNGFDGDWFYEMQSLGFNYRITDFQCALGISQFKKLDGFIKRRRSIVQRYNSVFKNIEGVIVPFEKSDVFSSYHLYVVHLDLDYFNRGSVFNMLRARRVGVQVHYIPIYHHPFYKKFLNIDYERFPVAESHYRTCLSLPLFPCMSGEDVDYVIDTVVDVLDHCRRAG